MHSTYSDGLDSVERMVLSALEKGMDVISITDHDTFEGSLAAAKFIKDKGLDIVLIYGNEVRAKYYGKAMDILILCPSPPDQPPPKDALKLYEWAVKRNCIYVPAHPYDERRYGCGESIYDLEMHAIEAWNARAPRKINERAIEVAKILRKPMLANSDAHDVEMVASAYSIIDAEPIPEEILDAIVKGRVKMVKGNVSPASYAKYVGRKLAKKSVRHLFLRE